MGLFDIFYLEEPIQCKCGGNHYDFQTKDLDNMLDEFYLRKDGVIETLDYTTKILPERNTFGFPQVERILNGYKELKDFNKEINIYTPCKFGVCWINIYLKFVDSKLKTRMIEYKKLNEE